MVVSIFASVISPRALPAAVGVAGTFWLLRWIAHGRLTIRTPADWAIILLAATLPVTLWVTPASETTQPQVYRLLTGILLYYAVVNWGVSFDRLRLLAMATIFAGFGLAVMAPVTVAWSHNRYAFLPSSAYSHFPSLLSEPLNPNVMAGALVVVLPVVLALLLFNWHSFSRLGRTTTGVTAFLTLGMLILTQSRGALTGLGVAVLVMAGLRWRHGWFLAPAIAVIAGVVVAIFGVGPVLDLLLKNDALGGIDVRLEAWSRALYLIEDFPFTGAGMGAFQPVTNLLYPFFLKVGGLPHAHNLFLQIAADLGIPGLIAWLATLVVVIVAAWQTYAYGRARGNTWIAGVGAGLVCSQLALAVHGLTDAPLWGPDRPAVIVWGLWGLGVAGWNVCRRRERQTQLEVEA